MNRHSDRPDDTQERLVRYWAAAVAAMFVVAAIYTAIFWGAMSVALSVSAIYALTNALPLTVLAAVFGLAIRRVVQPLAAPHQALAHATLAPLFTATWYGAIVTLQALVRVAQGREFELVNFAPQALAWQTFQGLTLYAAIAATVYAWRRDEHAPPQPESAERLERYFSKAGDTIHCIKVRDIVSISGAQDYSDVTTVSGRHLARFSLAEFERRLDPARFLRIHRSGIVNLDYFDRAEPAGSGCFIVTLRNGDTLRTSREGARRLRALLF